MTLFRIIEYLLYRWRAKNAYGLHSPFVYSFYHKVLRGKGPDIPNAHLIQSRYFQNKNAISFEDPKTKRVFNTTVKALSKRTWSGQSFSYFLIKLIQWVSASTFLETGTALGLNISMVSNAKGLKKIVSIEGSESLALEAQKLCVIQPNVEFEVITGSIYQVFEETYLSTKPEVVFLDADHRSLAIHFYLEVIHKHSDNLKVIVIHDIYWSQDMKNAWVSICKDPRFPLTIDCFHAGLIFFPEHMEKQHFTIKY